MTNAKFINSKVALLISLVLNFLYFPVWWYTAGFFKFVKNVFLFWRHQAYSLAVLIWIKNIFVPMYGQADFAGRLISFGIRLVQIIFRSLALLIWLLICLVAIFIWLVLPLLIVYLTAIQLGA
jgi:hypothetical protein